VEQDDAGSAGVAGIGTPAASESPAGESAAGEAAAPKTATSSGDRVGLVDSVALGASPGTLAASPVSTISAAPNGFKLLLVSLGLVFLAMSLAALPRRVLSQARVPTLVARRRLAIIGGGAAYILAITMLLFLANLL